MALDPHILNEASAAAEPITANHGLNNTTTPAELRQVAVKLISQLPQILGRDSHPTLTGVMHKIAEHLRDFIEGKNKDIDPLAVIEAKLQMTAFESFCAPYGLTFLSNPQNGAYGYTLAQKNDRNKLPDNARSAVSTYLAITELVGFINVLQKAEPNAMDVNPSHSANSKGQ